MTDHYAVVGNPVAHSKSPMIHAAFARQTGHDIAYGRLLAPLDGFTACVAKFREDGGLGVNVTVPFKLEAYALATRHTPRARLAQACNCLRFDADAILGDNTDGNGIVTDIEANLRFALQGRRVLVMGAGGAVQGVLGPLLDQLPETLVIANRTVEKARRLAQYFLSEPHYAGASLNASAYGELAGARFDVVINGTSASLNDALPDLPEGAFGAGSLAYDMMYGKGDTPFLRLARSQGAAVLADGLGMLVEQAAESFLLWRGVRPDTAPVIDLLRRT